MESYPFGNYSRTASNDTADPTYPHDFENYILIYPQMVMQQKFYEIFMRQSYLQVWPITIILFSIVRKFLRHQMRSPRFGWIDLLVDTFGVAFVSTGGMMVRNRPERILMLFVSIFGLTTNILFSGLLFQRYSTTVNLKEINTLEELGDTINLPIRMADDIGYLETWLETK